MRHNIYRTDSLRGKSLVWWCVASSLQNYLIYPKKETDAKSIALDQLASPPATKRRCACLIHRASSAALLGNGPVMQGVFSVE